MMIHSSAAETPDKVAAAAGSDARRPVTARKRQGSLLLDDEAAQLLGAGPGPGRGAGQSGRPGVQRSPGGRPRCPNLQQLG
jgi:hypothetical protein